MSALYLAGLLLAAPPETAARPPLVAPPALIFPQGEATAAELRKVHTDALRQSHRVGVSDSVPDLVSVYRLLEQDKQLTSTQRAELRFKVRRRLLSLGDQIVNEVRRERAKQRQQEAAAKRTVSKPVVAPSASAPASASSVAAFRGSGKPSDYAIGVSPDLTGRAGGLGEDQGDELVELIRATIAPESWDTAGGPGSIYYWRQWQVLVVRQTDEVHWLIGGLRGALGK
jgi:hypothetical protein